MKDAANFKHDANRFAVVRHYEPTRIERELLAKVFEIVSQRPEEQDEDADQKPAAITMGDSQVAGDEMSPRTDAPLDATDRDLLEPAA